jgi:uncharacterized protein YqjF (DUF2071 family)
MNQDWRDLAYVHWAVDPGRVAAMMPPGVRPDELDGATYVGLVPFRMVDAGPGQRLSVPWLGTFLETNIRLYSVDEQGRRGVVFLSLDTDRLGVVLGARGVFSVPYRWAAMSYAATPVADGVVHDYRSRLRWPGVRATSRVVLRAGAAREASAVDDFVSARWRLHTRHLGLDLHVPNEHGRWSLQDAELLDLEAGSLLASVGLGELADREPDHTAFSAGVHTRFGLPRRTRGRR